MTIPPIVVTSFRHTGIGAEGLLALGIALLVSGLVWKRSLYGFHRSWVSADPRMTTQQAKAWMASSNCGWSLPSLQMTFEVLWRYLTHNASYSGAPGIWIPPSTRSNRIWIASLVAGCGFALATGWQAVLQPFQVWLPIAVVTSFILVCAGAVWATGEACWLNQECERQLGGDGRTVFQRHSDRLRHSEHEAKDPITGARIERRSICSSVGAVAALPDLPPQPASWRTRLRRRSHGFRKN